MKEVGGVVQQMQAGDTERPVVISGDKKVEYDAILQIMDGLKQQGIAARRPVGAAADVSAMTR